MGAYENYLRVRSQVEQCAKECGRDPQSVRLIAVSKTVGPDQVKDAIRAGAADFGENRPDVLTEKTNAIEGQTWHFIGNIQSRKIPQIVASTDLIHSLYQLSHAQKIDAAASRLGKVQKVLVEVNVSGEESKSGCTPEEAAGLVLACSALEHVQVCGLMTMAPIGDPETAFEVFSGLASLRQDILALLDPQKACYFNELSMGMSQDWPQAVAAGATMVRIGRAIFSDGFAG